MRRRCILHIGIEKTGTTSIQGVLAASRDALVAQGFAYPRAPGARNHVALADHAAEPGRRPGARGGAAGLAQALADEIAALPDAVHTLVFSNEHCHSRLLTEAEVARLRALLDPFVSDWRILCYLRRQDELAVSLHSTALRTGESPADVLPADPERVRPYYDFAALLDRWGAVFGRSAVTPRLYARGALREDDVVADFLAACGIVLPDAAVAAAPRDNPSLGPAAQELLRRFNATAPPAQRRGLLAALGLPARLSRLGPGPGRLVARGRAEAFADAFAASNEAVRAAWFPGRERLFDADFSRYPDHEPPVAEAAEVLDLAVAALVESARRLRGLDQASRAGGAAMPDA